MVPSCSSSLYVVHVVVGRHSFSLAPLGVVAFALISSFVDSCVALLGCLLPLAATCLISLIRHACDFYKVLVSLQRDCNLHHVAFGEASSSQYLLFGHILVEILAFVVYVKLRERSP